MYFLFGLTDSFQVYIHWLSWYRIRHTFFSLSLIPFTEQALFSYVISLLILSWCKKCEILRRLFLQILHSAWALKPYLFHLWWQLLQSADNKCKQCRSWSGLTKCWTRSWLKYLTLWLHMYFLNIFLKNWIEKKNKQMTIIDWWN